MGFDVTFHPVSPPELQRFVFDVIADPKLKIRCNDVTADGTKVHAVRDIYLHFPEWQKASDDEPAVRFAKTFGFAAAAIAGFLHPYWYVRGGSLTNLVMESDRFNVLLDKLHASAPPGSEYIIENYSSGGFVAHDKLAKLATLLTDPDNAAVVEATLGAHGRVSLEHAIAYATSRGLGLLEASDVVVPGAGECVTDIDNLRAEHLRNLADTSNARRHKHRSLAEALDERDTRVTALEISGAEVTTLDGIGRLTDLCSLDCHHSELSTLPSEIGALSNLEYLSIHRNKLTRLPPEIGNLTKLSSLSAYGNAIESLPREIGGLTELRQLDLTNNRLTELPDEIGRLENLTTVFLGGNPFPKKEKDRIKALLSHAKTVMFTVPSRYKND